MTSAAPRPAYRVLSPRLELRCYEPGDAAALHAALGAGTAHLLPWLPWALLEPQTVEDKVALLRKFRSRYDADEDYVVGAFDRAAPGVLLGGSGIHLRVGVGAGEIGYWVRAGHERRGLATEMAAALTRVGFAVHGFHKMAVHCHADNVASARVPEKLGYRNEGRIRRSVPHADAAPGDRLVFGMLREEFAASPAARTPVEAFDVLGRPLPTDV